MLDGTQKLMPIYEDVFEHAQDETTNDNEKSTDGEENESHHVPTGNRSYLNSATNSCRELDHSSDVEHSSNINQTAPSQS